MKSRQDIPVIHKKLKTSTEIKEKVEEEWAKKMNQKEDYEAKWKEFSDTFKKKKK